MALINIKKLSFFQSINEIYRLTCARWNIVVTKNSVSIINIKKKKFTGIPTENSWKPYWVIMAINVIYIYLFFFKTNKLNKLTVFYFYFFLTFYILRL